MTPTDKGGVDLKTVHLKDLRVAGMGDTVLIDRERWTLDGTFESQEQAEAIGKRWARGGYWTYKVVENRVGTGEWRHCPYALLLRYTGATKGNRDHMEVSAL